MLNDGCHYLGLDYYLTAEWYHTRPDVYGDAQRMPISDNCIDTALLLDVLEHLPDPRACLNEIHRVLKADGRLILQVPFIYPLHDTPLDFQRWSEFGLSGLVAAAGFRILGLNRAGTPLETAALLSNIGLCRAVYSWMKTLNPLAILILLLPVLVPAINLLALVLSRMSRQDNLMPHGYRMVLAKQSRAMTG
jgi:SAM-dependent methyltransferase